MLRQRTFWTLLLLGLAAVVQGAEPKRPNILWITCEDTSPDLGCYGDTYAHTPTLDRLAREGVRYTAAFSHAPVCAPARSGLITGMYPSTLGTHNMRSNVLPPPGVRAYSAHLRDAGYFCTNNAKTDYNFPVPKDAWDENGPQAHWKHRPRADQPFFAIFNLTVTHESQARPTPEQHARNTARLKPEQRHDPALAKLPAYFPDTPIVRRNWAIMHDTITAMDYQVADLLKELDDAGLADSTIVFFYGDHGRGLTRGKRWLYDSGLQVPLLIRWPGKLEPNTVNDELVAFVDFGPTVLSLAGVKIPANMQGQAFLGEQRAKPRDYIYGARDRMDERYDFMRAVRDQRFKYIRNFEPWKPYAQQVMYMNQMPICQELRRLNALGQLDGAPALWMAATKPAEELYDCQADPEEIHNLANDPAHRATLERLRGALAAWCVQTNDLGFLPEPSMYELIARDGHDWREKLIASGLLARLRQAAAPDLFGAGEPLSGSVENVPPEVAWWLVRTGRGPESWRTEATRSPLVRCAQADWRARHGQGEQVLPMLVELLGDESFAVALQAALTLDELGAGARPVMAAMLEANARQRPNDYVARVTENALTALGSPPKQSVRR